MENFERPEIDSLMLQEQLERIEGENQEIKVVLHRAMEAIMAMNARIVELEKKAYGSPEEKPVNIII